jgi:hypothetical protein
LKYLLEFGPAFQIFWIFCCFLIRHANAGDIVSWNKSWQLPYESFILFFTSGECTLVEYIWKLGLVSRIMDQRTRCVMLLRRCYELRNRVIVRPASLALREQNAYYRGNKASVTAVCLHCRCVTSRTLCLLA